MNVLHLLRGFFKRHLLAFLCSNVCAHLKLFHGSGVHSSLNFPFCFVTATFHHSRVSCVANTGTFDEKSTVDSLSWNYATLVFADLRKMTLEVIDEFPTTYWYQHSEATDNL